MTGFRPPAVLPVQPRACDCFGFRLAERLSCTGTCISIQSRITSDDNTTRFIIAALTHRVGQDSAFIGELTIVKGMPPAVFMLSMYCAIVFDGAGVLAARG